MGNRERNVKVMLTQYPFGLTTSTSSKMAVYMDVAVVVVHMVQKELNAFIVSKICI